MKQKSARRIWLPVVLLAVLGWFSFANITISQELSATAAEMTAADAETVTDAEAAEETTEEAAEEATELTQATADAEEAAEDTDEADAAATTEGEAAAVPTDELDLPVAVQLYSLRDFGSFEEQLALVAETGYANVELVGDHGLSAEEMNELLERYNLQAVSAHYGLGDLRNNLDGIVEFSQAIDNQNIVMPWLPQEMRPDTAEGWQELGRELGEIGARLLEARMNLAYHNHDFEMVEIDGQLALDWLLEDIEPGYLALQLDVAWIERGGQDPAALIARYDAEGHDIISIHAKDVAPEGEAQDEGGWADVGHGIVDWQQVLPAARDANVVWYIVEHDNPNDHERFLRRSLEFLSEHADLFTTAAETTTTPETTEETTAEQETETTEVTATQQEPATTEEATTEEATTEEATTEEATTEEATTEDTETDPATTDAEPADPTTEDATTGGTVLVEDSFDAELDENVWQIYDNNSGGEVVVENGQLRIEGLGTDGWDTNQLGIVLSQSVNLAGNVTTITVDYAEAGWNEQNPGFWSNLSLSGDIWNEPGFRLTVSGSGFSPTFTPAADGSFEPGFNVDATPPYRLEWVLTHEEGSVLDVEVYVDGEFQGESEMDLGSMDPSELYFYLYASNDTNPGPAVFERVSITQEREAQAGAVGEPLTVEEDFTDELDEEVWGIYDNNPDADVIVEGGQLRIEGLGTDGWDSNQKGIFLRQPLNLANNVTTVEADYVEAGWNEQNPGFWTSDEITDDLWNHPGFRLTVSGEGFSPTFTPAADGSFDPGFSVDATPPYTLRWVLTHEEGSVVNIEAYVDGELQGESEMDLGSIDPSALYFYLYASNDTNPGPAVFERVSISQQQAAAAAAPPVQDPEAAAAAAEQAQLDAQTQVPQTGLDIERLTVDEDLNVLMFTRTEGFRHGSIETAHEVMERLAEERGFAVTITEDATVFTDDNLAQYDVIMFGVTTGSVLQPQQREAMIHFIRNGGGFVGVHSASDTHYDWEWYGNLVGAYFNGHPPGTQNARLVVEDPVHPSVAHLGSEFEINDEWYFWDANPRGSVHVLMTLDRSSHPFLAGFAEGDPEADHPITWCHPYQGGRSWYTALGHPDWVWEDERFQEMLMGGILWTARQVEGDCDVDFNQIILEPLVEGMNEPMNLEVDQEGRVFYVERPGNVRVWDEEHGVRNLLELDVYTEEEHGLMGLALDPDFSDNGYVYLYYSPLAHETDNFLSRFTLIEGEEGELALDPESEEVLLQVYSDRETCCHQAGNLVFGPDGTLYLGTGDNTNPFESQGYSPIDRREGREYFNAIRTSGNPNDLRGNILRINRDGTIPEDNPFVGDPEVRDEIYAIGFRNPFRFHVDPVTGWVLVGNVGQDASNDDPERGPAGYDEWYIVTEPGQVAGWPFCTGPAEPFVDYDFETEEGQGLFDCSETIPAVIWYKYAETEQFPELGTGGRNAQAGPILRDPGPDAQYRWRDEYLNKWFIYEWTRHFIKMVTLGENGTELPELHSYYTIGAPDEYGQVPRPDLVIEDFVDDLSRPMDLTQAPDGALYLLEYGTGWFEPNEDARLSRIYNKITAAPPVAMASAEPSSGQGPLTVQFSAEGSFDVDGDGITAFEWDFGDGTTSTEANPIHTYTEDDDYQVTLRAIGSYGTVGESDPILVVVGNTAPEAEIVRPLPGALFEQNQTVTLAGAATDAEEGELVADSLEWEVVARRMVGGEAQEETVLSATGASAELDLGGLETYDWHGAVTYLVRLTATDSEGLSGTTETRVRYTRLQAQGADQLAGVQFQSTRDEDGEEDAVLSRSGDYLAWEEVDVTGRGPAFVRVDADMGSVLELRAGGPEGDALGSAEVTGGEGWQTVAIPFSALEGSQDLYLVAQAAEGDEVDVAINWLQLVGPGPGQ